MYQQMRVLMCCNLPPICRGTVESNELPILPTHVESCKVDGFAAPEGRKMAQLIIAIESDDLQRDGGIQLDFEKDLTKCRSDLFESQCRFAPAFLAGVRNDVKVR